MTQKQQPLGSRFTAASTAADVVKGIDLSGRNAIVTGGHVGLGLETTRALAAAGASVVVGTRDPGRAAPALEGIERVEVERLDLTDPSSVDAFAARYTATGRPLHILVNNAGVMDTELVRDARGYENQFATNHLGHFQLSNGLLPALRAASGARVVTLSSWSHHQSDINWDDVHFETGSYDGAVAYGQSKTANALFAVELDRRWSADGIRGYSVHPGSIFSTNLSLSLTIDDRRAMGIADEAGSPIIDPARGLKTSEQGASTTVWGATSPLLADIGGVYLMDNDVAPIDEATVDFDLDVAAGDVDTSGGVMPYAVDPESAQRLWELSEQLLKA
ncbi:SDR family NAD(P)-dependent oxidoreductase [Mycobacterium sp. AZCC_0083]|uniref:SDR family NAD(P)-dependent oxidoreductase n=1 Tax=Mycobacterium sp. AZCC_0083 TaxID=2735882 RepID=UPI0016120F16|nr:SDR family NAD(P)-dependent oxidoreductase [Mycobacterium sp. AZCC_0083]MBB5161663.1 NAD(P)-dependent dehydrogenase (short-subunit alcohol dehydrogenase family) [Mycobacterium sp. AZCC_0083]